MPFGTPVTSNVSLSSAFRAPAPVNLGTLNYVVSLHAAEELEDDNLNILDLESIVLTGKIIARQRDARTHEVKYVIAGATLDGEKGEVVAKVGVTGKLFVITVYRA